ncbi:MAG: hypothetical protein IJZ75_01745 [Clostridia bacterium]|nr:hypothetical protein [Clostridia bacterium]
MKKLYEEFLYISPKGKIREKVMLVRVTLSVIFILACLAGMSLTAYAYFSHSITSEYNIIKTAAFDTDVSVNVDTVEGKTLEVKKGSDRSYIVTLEANTPYRVTVTPSANSTASTGFCVITAENCESRYHTMQLGTEGDSVKDLTFYLTVSQSAQVKFEAHWGTSIHYDEYKNNVENEELYILNGDTVNMSITAPFIHAEETAGEGETSPDTVQTEELAEEEVPSDSSQAEESTEQGITAPEQQEEASNEEQQSKPETEEDMPEGTVTEEEQ